MKLHRLCDVSPDASGIVCRQARISGTITLLVFTAILLGVPVFLQRVGAPWFFQIVFLFPALVVVPLLIGDVRARWRRSNWLLWAPPGSLWINFRSYQDQSPADWLCIVQLEDHEVAELCQFIEKISSPGSDGGSVRSTVRSLDVRLDDLDTEELRTALVDSRHHEQPERVYLGFIRGRSKPAQFPVSLPQPNVIRISWRGGTSWVAPSLKKILAELGERIKVAEPVTSAGQDWTKLSDAEFDDRILELTRAGNRIDAVKLLVERRGYSTTKASQFVRELDERI